MLKKNTDASINLKNTLSKKNLTHHKIDVVNKFAKVPAPAAIGNGIPKYLYADNTINTANIIQQSLNNERNCEYNGSNKFLQW